MNKSMLAAVLLFPVVAGGTWLGCRWFAPTYVPYRQGYTVVATCGGGNYSKETFRIVNDELQRKLVELLGNRVGPEHLVAVLPEISGYRVQMFGPPASKLGENNLDRDLGDWIYARMEEVEREILQEAHRLDEEGR